MTLKSSVVDRRFWSTMVKKKKRRTLDWISIFFFSKSDKMRQEMFEWMSTDRSFLVWEQKRKEKNEYFLLTRCSTIGQRQEKKRTFTHFTPFLIEKNIDFLLFSPQSFIENLSLSWLKIDEGKKLNENLESFEIDEKIHRFRPSSCEQVESTQM